MYVGRNEKLNSKISKAEFPPSSLLPSRLFLFFWVGGGKAGRVGGVAGAGRRGGGGGRRGSRRGGEEGWIGREKREKRGVREWLRGV